MLHLPDDLDNRRRYSPVQPFVLQGTRKTQYRDPARYLPDDGLVDAIRVALMLRKPLLLTGEPGTGKTDVGYYLSWKLGHRDEEGRPRLLFFEAKSTSTARDLFYTYDTLGHFYAAQTDRGSNDPRDYITYNSLGLAILLANPEDAVHDMLPKDFKHYGPVQSVVLIDEIDKAPRDFPNDILNELDRMYFRVTEMANKKISAAPGLEPILVITSNSEKNLPAPFLRRCVYYNIPFDENKIQEIVAARVDDLSSGTTVLQKDAIRLFLELRNENTGLHKAPATAELLDWLLYLLSQGADKNRPLREQGPVVKSSLSALIKDEQDQKTASQVVATWLAGPQVN